MSLRASRPLGETQIIGDDFEKMDKSGIPRNVYYQLSKEFVPAIKEVGQAGTDLLKNYQALQRSSEQYVYALNLLVHSSKKAFPTARQYGSQLSELVNEYSQILESHKICIRKLATLVTKTVTKSTEEQSTLKEMLRKYQKDEKKLLKMQKKGDKSAADVSSFYDETARQFLQQQEVRYKYFHDGHRNWFTTYANLIANTKMDKICLKENDNIANNDNLNSNVVTATEICPVQPTDSTIECPPTIIMDGFDDKSRASTVQSTKNITQPPNTRPLVVEDNLSATQEENVAVPAPTPRTRENITLSKVVETPVKDQTIVTSQYQESDCKNEVIKTPRRSIVMQNGEINDTYNRPMEWIQFRPAEPDFKRISSDKISYNTPPVGGRMVLPQLIEVDRPHYRVESKYDTRVSLDDKPTNYVTPHKQEVVVPALFTNGDYGRILTVNQDFNASSGEQITVNRGDKVVLIKNGTRGWIFIKDKTSQRTGWIPAPFVSY